MLKKQTNMINATATPPEKVKSVTLTREQMNGLKKLVGKSKTKFAAAKYLGLSRQTLDSILLRGSCRPDSEIKINDALNVPA